MKYGKLFMLLALTSLIFSCKKENDTDLIDFRYDYINNTIGNYITYQVDSTIYNDFDNSVRSSTNMFKDKVVDQFTDNLGRTAYRVERSVLDTASQTWRARRSYYYVLTASNLERVEENLRYVVFLFPPKVGLTWAGNKYIDPVDNNKFLSNWNYTFSSVDVPASINGIDYPITSTVLLVDKENAIEKIFAKETYAEGIGLVYKEWWHLETQKIVDDPWTVKAQKGFIVKMQATGHGIE